MIVFATQTPEYTYPTHAIIIHNASQEKMELDMKKIVYVGDGFGYTATSSPFVALYRAIEREQIKRGDYVLFWTAGTGWQNIAMLFKY
jgi:3-oxoacyl-[acyl-carrier-protein] synthase III